MPTFKIKMDNTEDSVSRPVILSITRQMMDFAHISSKTPIRFLGEEDKAAQQNSRILNQLGKDNIWASDEFVTIEVEEEIDKDYLGQITTFKPNSLLVFKDEILGIGIKPVYAMHNVSINVKYTTKDRTRANSWRNRIVANVADQLMLNMHDVSYHYEFKENLLQLLYHIWELRQKQGGYEEDFNEYIKRRITPDRTILTDAGGKNNLMVINERVTRIQGYFDFDGVPDKAEKPNDSENREIGFSYKFSYEKPVAYMVKYPIIIHNQLIDQKYLPIKKKQLSDKVLKYSESTQALRAFENDERQASLNLNYGIMIPWFDEFKPRSILPSSAKIFSALCAITMEDKRTLFNLSEPIGDYMLNENLLAFIKNSEKLYVNNAFESILSLELYSNNNYMGSNVLEIMDDFTVVAKTDLDIRNVYNIRLSIITNFKLLTEDAKSRLDYSPEVKDLLVTILNKAMNAYGASKDIGRTKLGYDHYVSIGYSKEQALELVAKWAMPRKNEYGVDADEFVQNPEYAFAIKNNVFYNVQNAFVSVYSNRPE